MFDVSSGSEASLPSFISFDNSATISVYTTDVNTEATYTIRVKSTLDDGAATQAQTDFSLVVGDGCQLDQVSLTTGIQDTTYDIANPAVPLTLTPTFAQTVTGCALTYSITQDGASVDPALITFDAGTGALTVETSDSAYFGQTPTIVVRCTSDESASFQETSFVLTLRDHCYGTTVSPPTFSSPPADMDVWSTQAVAFNPASESISTCGPFSYSATVNGLDASKFTVTSTEITFAPDALAELGTVEFTLTATLDNYGLTATSAS